MVTKLAFDELLRFEEARDADIQHMYHIMKSQNRNYKESELMEHNKNEASLQRRQQWRLKREKELISLFQNTEIETLDRIRDYCADKKRSNLGDYFCLHSWGKHEYNIEHLWDMSIAYYEQVFASFVEKPIASTRPPGQVIKEEIQRINTIEERDTKAAVIQSVVRGWLARRLFVMTVAGVKVSRWYRKHRPRYIRWIKLRQSSFIRKIFRFLKWCRLRRLSYGDIVFEEKNLSLLVIIQIVRIQNVARTWQAVRRYRWKQYQNKLRVESRNRKLWQRDRVCWFEIPHQDLTSLCKDRVQLEKDRIEMELLRTLEIQRCKKQYHAFVSGVNKQLASQKKLPAGWVLHEAELENDASRVDKYTLVEEGTKYLNLKTGRVTSRHPQQSLVEENTQRQRAKAETVLADTLNTMQDNRMRMEAAFDYSKRQYMSRISFRLNSSYTTVTRNDH